VNIRKILQRRIRHAGKGANGIGDVNAVIAANVNERNSRAHVSTRSRQRSVQRSDRATYVSGETTARGPTRSRGDVATDTEPEADDAGATEPSTPPIDEDITGSVNAALPDAEDD
jgi:hypothetical protein